MCGISGIITKNNTSVNKSEIQTMNDIIAHRGPDGDGFLVEENYAFGHRRLAIIDLTRDADQPMMLEDKYSIVFNGEIYNYLEIREELKDVGYSFKTSSDTEVILNAYDYWGSNCVNKFNGMWAFSLLDKTKKNVFFSRDRFGVKPLYYFDGNDKFAFGSEIKQLLPCIERKVNITVLLEYLVLGLEEQSEDTFFQGIKRLSPGHNMTYNLTTNEVKIEKYYSLELKSQVNNLPLNEVVSLCRSSLLDSIKLRLRSDVKVGSCLSGGLDSSTISAIASSMLIDDNKLNAVHAKSSEKNTDESNFAQKVAENNNIDLHIVTPTMEDFISKLDDLVYTQEEPIPDPSLYMQYIVFEKAKEIGCKVMLDGQGGDETLLGYERYFPSLLGGMSMFKKLTRIYDYSRKSRLSFKDSLLYYFYFSFPIIREKRLLKKFNFIKKSFLNKLDTSVLYVLSAAYKDPVELQKLELTKTQLPHLLKYEDKNSMAHSIESRLPFLDYRFVENAISYQPEFKIRNGWSKYVLREVASEYLPDTISWRRDKKGFESPKFWLDNKDVYLPIIRKSKIISKITDGKIDNLTNELTWRLYSIAIWENTFKVQMDDL